MRLSAAAITLLILGIHAIPEYDYKKCLLEHGGKRIWLCGKGCDLCMCTKLRLKHIPRACPVPHPEYNYAECVKVHGEGGWLCEDGCNTCLCTKGGIVSTEMACGQELDE